MKNKILIIIDCDPGVDDALAIMTLLNSPEVEVLAITTVAGNRNLQIVTNNALTICKEIKKDIPIYSGADAPLVGKLIEGSVMGKTGLGGVDKIDQVKLNNSAVTKLVELVAKRPGEITILAIGPLTNIARALQADKNFSKNIKQLVIMGGSFNGVGNANRVAEFNFFIDPLAAQIVMNYDCKKIIIPLDRCYEIPLFESDFLQLKDSPQYVFIMKMMGEYIKNLKKFEGQNGAIVYDALAAYFILQPELFELEDFQIDIEVKGTLTRGMCVVEKRPNIKPKKNVSVVTKIDVELIKQGLLERLSFPRIGL